MNEEHGLHPLETALFYPIRNRRFPHRVTGNPDDGVSTYNQARDEFISNCVGEIIGEGMFLSSYVAANRAAIKVETMIRSGRLDVSDADDNVIMASIGYPTTNSSNLVEVARIGGLFFQKGRSSPGIEDIRERMNVPQAGAVWVLVRMTRRLINVPGISIRAWYAKGDEASDLMSMVDGKITELQNSLSVPF
jgi:hypothetical protein